MMRSYCSSATRRARAANRCRSRPARRDRPRQAPATVADHDGAGQRRSCDASARRACRACRATLRRRAVERRDSIAAGVLGDQPRSISRAAIARDVAEAHQHDDASRCRARASGPARSAVSAWPETTTNAGRKPAVRDRNAGQRRRARSRRLTPGHDLERQCRRPRARALLRRRGRTRTDRRT